MAIGRFSESVVEDAALAWLAELGWVIKHGPEIAPGELFAERKDYGEVVLLERFRNALRPKLMSGEIRTTQRRTA